MQIFKIDQWTATPQEKHNSDGCWSHENIILSFKCLNGSLAACTRRKRVGKILTLESLTGRFVLMKALLSLRTVSFKKFSATLSKVNKLIFYDFNLVSRMSCFLWTVLFSITVCGSIKTKKLSSIHSIFCNGVNSMVPLLELYNT